MSTRPTVSKTKKMNQSPEKYIGFSSLEKFEKILKYSKKKYC